MRICHLAGAPDDNGPAEHAHGAVALCVPLALDNLTSAAQLIRDNKPEDALQKIMDAQLHLEQLAPVFEAACEEAKSDDHG
jgi:hypothetical protein